MRIITIFFTAILLTITTSIFADMTGVVSFQSEAIDFTQAQLVPLIMTGPNERFIARSVGAHCDSFQDVTKSLINGSWGWTDPDYDDMGYTTMVMYDVDDYYIYNNGFENAIKSVPENTQLYFKLANPGEGSIFTGKIMITGFYN